MSGVLVVSYVGKNNYLRAGLAHSKQRLLSKGHIQEEDSSLHYTLFVFRAPGSKRILDTWPTFSLDSWDPNHWVKSLTHHQSVWARLGLESRTGAKETFLSNEQDST